jgi:hypothetical protein
MTRPRAKPPIPGCLQPGGLWHSSIFDFEIVEKNGVGRKLVLPGRGLVRHGPKHYKPGYCLVIAAAFSLNRSAAPIFTPHRLPHLTIVVAPPHCPVP